MIILVGNIFFYLMKKISKSDLVVTVVGSIIFLTIVIGFGAVVYHLLNV